MVAGDEDVYWSSFLPAFLEKMGAIMRKNITAAVADYGLTSAHSIYLVALNIKEGQTLMGLSKFLDLDPANTNRIVKVLKDKNLVYDDRKTPSCKKYSVYLTKTGKALSDKIMEGIEQDNAYYFRGISPDDVLRMKNTLIKMMENMGADDAGCRGPDDETPFYTRLQMSSMDDFQATESRRVSGDSLKIKD